MLSLARRLLGAQAVLAVHAQALPGDAALARVGDEWRIYYRRALSWERREFAIAHELAEWHLRHEDYREPDVEQVADRLAAALVAPRERFARLLREDRRFPVVARQLRATESLCVLRAGEVTGEPLALVAERVRVRGEPWGWPETEEEIRRLVVLPRAPRGLARARLRDDPRRVVLRGVAA